MRLRDANRTAQAEKAHFDRVVGAATLTGSVTITDGTSRTTARSGTFVQASNEFHADGDVVTSEIAADNSTAGSTRRSGGSTGPGGAGGPGGPGRSGTPAHISADHLVANTATGHGVYTGRARLWQGDSIVEADRVELDRATQTLTAISRVRAIFPQAPAAGPTAGAQPSRGAAAPRPPAQPDLMHAEADRMIYVSAEHRAHLEQNARVRTDQGSVRSSVMDLFFAPDSPKAQPGASPQPAASL